MFKKKKSPFHKPSCENKKENVQMHKADRNRPHLDNVKFKMFFFCSQVK